MKLLQLALDSSFKADMDHTKEYCTNGHHKDSTRCE